MLGDLIPHSDGTLAARLPARFDEIRYDGDRFPGAPGVGDIAGGANCQLYAYAVLAHFGLVVPPLRSSELWSDERLQTVTGQAQPLDLVLYGRTANPYGAHVGVVVGQDAVLHLCKEVGHPVVWDQQAFAARDRYRVRIGARRAVAAPLDRRLTPRARQVEAPGAPCRRTD